MLAYQSPNSGNNQIHKPKTVRKPLQLKNSPISNTNLLIKSNRESHPRPWIEITVSDDSNKENVPPDFVTPMKTESRKVVGDQAFDASLADELNAIREKIQRMKEDKEKTEKILCDRATMLDIQMNEILRRGEEQKQMEIEVDRLFRLKELKLSCMRILPIRSLREKVVKPKKSEEEDQLQSQSQETSSSIGIEQSRDTKACESESRSESSEDAKEELS